MQICKIFSQFIPNGMSCQHLQFVTDLLFSIMFHINVKLFYRKLIIPYDKKDLDACVTYIGCINLIKHAVILTHGAGGDKDLEQLVRLGEHLSGQQLLVIRFTCKGLNIKYRTSVYRHVMVICHQIKSRLL